jgi:hypothetical protein
MGTISLHTLQISRSITVAGADMSAAAVLPVLQLCHQDSRSHWCLPNHCPVQGVNNTCVHCVAYAHADPGYTVQASCIQQLCCQASGLRQPYIIKAQDPRALAAVAAAAAVCTSECW